jgi:MFS family permease
VRDGALSERPFRLLFASRAISAVGSRLAPVALAFAVLGIHGSPTDLGLVLAASTVPFLLLVLFGGVWADRLPRVRVMVIADAVRGAAQAASAALLIGGHARVWELVVLQAVYGTALAFFGPASTAVVPQTVAPAHFQQANAILELTDSVSSFVGPVLAGVVIAALSPGWGLAFDAATFAAGALLILPLRVPAPPERAATSTLMQLREGWRAFRRRTWLSLSVLFFTLYLAVCYAPLQVLGPVVARQSLGGPSAWAAISAALGVGALAGGALALRWRPRHPLRAGFLVIGIGVPLPILLGARAPLAALIVAALADGVCGSFFNTVWFTAQQRYVPSSEFSRVS